jgi:hypothetical protein
VWLKEFKMAEMITKKMLDAKIEYINRLDPGKNYELSMQYGGYSLTKKGGSVNVFNCGHIPRRALYDRLNAYIEGICVYQ